MQYRIQHADCLDALRAMADHSIDSIVTDPPYGLSFMGNQWDYDVPSVEIWGECLRVLKPGGHLLAFAGTRTQHRMAVRIEDAGFEIRDMIAWVYGSGFPKSHNLTGEHEGWGTALKPALEPITVARKPLIGTVAANVLAHGTGAINVDRCRVSGESVKISVNLSIRGGNFVGGSTNEAARASYINTAGRWPANLIHDGSDDVLAAFPDAPGQQANASTSTAPRNGQHIYGTLRRGRGDEQSADSENAGAAGFKMRPGVRRMDGGSAARFFYCAKASRADRNEGLPSSSTPALAAGATMREREDADWPARNGNHHPTVKPTDLMAYLCRLVTPPGGTVLDPFMGSGSTGKAAVLEGFKFIGIEREAAYVEIAKQRIAHAIGECEPFQERPPDQTPQETQPIEPAQRGLFLF